MRSCIMAGSIAASSCSPSPIVCRISLRRCAPCCATEARRAERGPNANKRGRRGAPFFRHLGRPSALARPILMPALLMTGHVLAALLLLAAAFFFLLLLFLPLLISIRLATVRILVRCLLLAHRYPRSCLKYRGGMPPEKNASRSASFRRAAGTAGAAFSFGARPC